VNADSSSALELERTLLQRVLDENAQLDPSGTARISRDLAAGDAAGDHREQERFLHDRYIDLRHVLRSRADRSVVDRFASPPSGRDADPGIDYGYERSAPSAVLDGRLVDGEPDITGWTASGVVCSSGMAALTVALHVAAYEFRSVHGRLPKVALLGDYFETTMLIELVSTSFASWSRCRSVAELVATRADVVVLEPVRYDWDLHTVDFIELSTAWAAQGAPRTVIVDPSLTPGVWPKQQLLTTLTGTDTATVIEARSALKLDQLGLELANAGAVVVHRNDALTAAVSDPETLRNARAVLGAALPPRSAIALDNSFFLDPDWRRTHVALVARNNEAFARALSVHRGLFETVAHPANRPRGADTRDGSVRVAPFTVLRLEDDDLLGYRLLLGVIRTEADRRGVDLQFGASFGFRSHRHETIVPRKRDLRCLLKVALGARGGPAMDGVIELFRDLHALGSMDAVRRHFRGVRPIELAL
jgi:hypothetical protein